jgi:hypothetical protein
MASTIRTRIVQVCSALFLFLFLTSSELGGNQQEKQTVDGRPYHDRLSAEALPQILDAGRFEEDRSAYVAYFRAAQIKGVLYQEPCYCPCGRSEGHRSLLDCFTGRHAATCHACRTEAVFCFEQTKNGKSPAEIREAMAKGDVWKFNLRAYTEAFFAEQEKERSNGSRAP